MVQSKKTKDDKLTFKENITSTITPYQLVGDIQCTEESLWGCNKKWKNNSQAGHCDSMLLLMTKFGILHCEWLFWCRLSDFWDFMKTEKDPHPLNDVVMKILQGKINPNRTLCGRFCCSINKRLCPVGELQRLVLPFIERCKNSLNDIDASDTRPTSCDLLDFM